MVTDYAIKNSVNRRLPIGDMGVASTLSRSRMGAKIVADDGSV